MSFDDWSQTAGSNTTVGGVSIAEGMSPGGLNNAIRGLMAEVAVWRDLVGGKVVSAGTADVQTITTGMSMGAYAQGILIGFEAGAALTNTGAMTINVDALGAKSVKLTTGANPPAGAVTAGGIFLIAYEATSDTLLLLNPSKINAAADITGDLPFANLAQGSALSVLGVTGNSTADHASIAAGSDHQVMRRSGTAVAFGAVNLAQSAAVTGTLPIANGGTASATAADAFTALKQAATESATGVVELATAAEAKAGTDTSRAVTAAGIAGMLMATPAAVSLDDDIAGTIITLPAGVSGLLFVGRVLDAQAGIFSFDTVGTYGITTITIVPTVTPQLENGGTGTATNGSGTDAKFTVYLSAGGVVSISNRLGATLSFSATAIYS